MNKSSHSPLPIRVDRYVRGLMSAEESAEFMQEMQHNPTLAYEVAEETALWEKVETVSVVDRVQRLASEMPEVLAILVDQEMEQRREPESFIEVLRRARDEANAARPQQELEHDGPTFGKNPLYPEPEHDLEPEP